MTPTANTPPGFEQPAIPFASLLGTPHIGRYCPLVVMPGYEMPYSLRVIDAATGETLLFIDKGQMSDKENCVKAPDDHNLIVIRDGGDVATTTIPGTMP